MLTLHLFGPPQILRDGQPVPVDRRKSRALLYYLAASSKPIQREALMAVFWPDIERPAAQQVLRTSLHGLRKVLGEALVVEREQVSLAPEVEVDARKVEQALSPLSHSLPILQEALSLYRGEFLQNFNLPDSVEFDDWLVVEKERYLRMAIRGWAALGRKFEEQGDPAAALAAVENALQLENLQEDLQREAVRLLYLTGDRAGAIRRYDQLRRLLDEELGVPPMAETRALYDDILNDHIQMLPPRSSGRETASRSVQAARSPDRNLLPFVSRSAELNQLSSAIFSRRLLLVQGEPGIGKTRLVEQFLSMQAGLALVGAGRELEHAMPYQPVIEALRGLFQLRDWPALQAEVRKSLPAIWLAEVTRLLPELDPARQPVSVDEWRLWEGVRQFLQVLARQRPLFLFLDDVQWADSSTLGLLGYLVRQSESATMGFLAAARPFAARTPLANLVQALGREERLVRVPLARFSSGEVRKFAERLSPRFSMELAEWLLRNSEGNPYILAELARDLTQRGVIGADGQVDLGQLPPGPVLPPSVYSLIQSRLARLSEPARRLVNAAVALGRDFDFDLAAHASALSEDAALDALDEVLTLGLIAPLSPNRYRFDHSLTLEVSYREVGEARHRRMHRNVAVAMESMNRRGKLDSLAGQLAFHYSEGEDLVRAAPYAYRAGQQAASLAAWREAAGYFEQALAGMEGVDRFPVLLDLGWSYYRMGQAAQASEVMHQAVDLATASEDDTRANTARLALAQSYLPQSRFPEAVREAQKVLDSGDPQLALEADLWMGTALSMEGADMEAAEFHLNRAAQRCRASSGSERLAQVEFELGSLVAQKGDLQTAVKHYHASLLAVEHSDSQAGIERRALAYNNLAYHLLLLDDPSAEEFAQAGMKLAQERGLLTVQTYLYSTLGEIALARRAFDEAEQCFQAGLNLSRQVSAPERIAGFTANLGLLARERSQPTRAVHFLSAAMAQADSLGTRHLAAQIRLWLVPLLPAGEARGLLSEARAIAESGRRQRLLDEIAKMEGNL